MKIIKRILKITLIIGVIVLLALPVKYIYDSNTYENTVEYRLLEVSDGIYGYYNTVSSSAPAYNCEVITLCLNGSVQTLRGHVNIYYTTGEPKLVWTQTKIINSDTINVYVPNGSIEMRPNVGLG